MAYKVPLIMLLISKLGVVLAFQNGFPNLHIPGPKSYDDRIAIVGAGPAGIHMAALLKEKGFRNIEILEKSSRIGGKSCSLDYRGVPHEMGTVYISSDYDESIIKLVDRYIPNDMIPKSVASVWLKPFPQPMSFLKYMIMYATKLYKGSKIHPARILMKEISNYIKLHKTLFGEYEFEIMPEPSKHVMQQIGGSCWDFLKRNNMLGLVPIFEAGYTIQGYGQLNETAALYCLKWYTPKLMATVMNRVQGRKDTGVYVLKNGFQNLWETIAKNDTLQVKFNVDIWQVERLPNGKGVLIKTIVDSKVRSEQYDFLIWSPEMMASMPVFKDISDHERKIFSKTTPMYFTTSLYDSEHEKRGLAPIDYFMDNVHNRGEHMVWAQRNSYGTIHQQSGEKYKKYRLPSGDDNKNTTSSVAYQMGYKPLEIEKIQKILINQMRSINGSNIEIIKSITWRYFPRYSIKDIEEGIIWRILDMQGQYNMWYIGSSVSFESVKSVVEYNKLLVKHMILPQKLEILFKYYCGGICSNCNYNIGKGAKLS